MKAIVNGRLILPDERGNFFVADGKILTFDEKIRAIGDTTDADEIIDAAGNFYVTGGKILTFDEKIRAIGSTTDAAGGI